MAYPAVAYDKYLIDRCMDRLLKFFELSFPGGSEGKASASKVGDMGSIPGSGRSPGEGKRQPTPVLLPGKSHGWRSLLPATVHGVAESDTTERLHFHFSLSKFNTHMEK